jgi:hypothetical protein
MDPRVDHWGKLWVASAEVSEPYLPRKRSLIHRDPWITVLRIKEEDHLVPHFVPRK